MTYQEETAIIQTVQNILNIEEETNRLREEYLSIEKNARKGAIRERSQLRNTGITKSEEIIKDTRKEVASIRAKADNNAERELEKAQPLLHGEAATLADDIIERVIGRRIGG